MCVRKRRKRQYTTDSKHNLDRYANSLPNRLTKPRQAIVGDVTAYDVKGRDYYLASLMDVYSRRLVGYAISAENNSELVKAALEKAKRACGKLEGCIHHTDSDVRYCSKTYISLLKSYKMKISMCVGNAYENAYAESLNASVKREEIRINDYDSVEASIRGIKDWIDKYNSYRPHGSLKGKTPLECEIEYHKINDIYQKKGGSQVKK